MKDKLSPRSGRQTVSMIVYRPLRGLMIYFLSILGFATLTPGFMLPAAPQPP
jgi:hypothetical protein